VRIARIVFSLVAVGALVSAGVWWLWAAPAGEAGSDSAAVAPSPSGAISTTTAPAVAEPPAPAASSANGAASPAGRPPDAPLPDGPIGTTYAELVRRAEAGDGRAAMAIARALALCKGYVDDERGALEDELVDLLAKAEDTPVRAGGRSSDHFIDMATGVIDMRETTCAGIDALGIQDPVAERKRWLALGLERGDPAALVEEAHAMMRTTYPRRVDIVSHAEELRLLRPHAMAMLQRAAAQGEPVALLRMASALRQGDLAQRDPVAAYAYMLAYRAGPPAAGVPGRLLDNLDRQLSTNLSPAELAAARIRAEHIRAACCGGRE
jgi:hypothetical protein